MKYSLSKRMEIAGSHQLELDYPSPCTRLHGHNWIITVHIEGDHLDQNGMLIDFKYIKEVVHQLDHLHANDVMSVNPTAENIAEWVSDQIQGHIDEDWGDNEDLKHSDVLSNYEIRPRVTKVLCQETEGNIACYSQ